MNEDARIQEERMRHKRSEDTFMKVAIVLVVVFLIYVVSYLLGLEWLDDLVRANH